jgi:hypothetical protein
MATMLRIPGKAKKIAEKILGKDKKSKPKPENTKIRQRLDVEDTKYNR